MLYINEITCSIKHRPKTVDKWTQIGLKIKPQYRSQLRRCPRKSKVGKT